METDLAQGGSPQAAAEPANASESTISLAPEALTSACFGFLANIATTFISTSVLYVLATLAASGVGIGLFWRLVRGARRRRAGGGGRGRRRTVLLLALPAVMIVPLALGVLQLAVVVAIMALVVLAVIGSFVLASVAPSLAGLGTSVAVSTTCACLAFGAGAAANGFANSGALDGVWEIDKWKVAPDDPHHEPVVRPQGRFTLDASDICIGHWCGYTLAMPSNQDLELTVGLWPGLDGGYQGRQVLRLDCRAADNPANVPVADGYEHTLVVRLAPDLDTGPPRGEQPTTIEIEITDTAVATSEARMKGCQDWVETIEVTAKRG